MKSLGNQTIIFLHIKKTAGTTLRNIILRNHHPSETFIIDHAFGYHHLHDLKNLSPHSKKNIKMVTGHIPFGIHKHIPGKSTYITLLRDPVDRVISYYYHILKHLDHYQHQWLKANKITLAQFARSHNIKEIGNAQVRQIAGIWDNPNQKHLNQDDLLKKALENIEKHFLLVGITELFTESLVLLKEKLHWQDCRFIPMNINSNRLRKEDISSEIQTIIAETNALDVQLYDYAQKQLREQIQKHQSKITRGKKQILNDSRNFTDENPFEEGIWNLEDLEKKSPLSPAEMIILGKGFKKKLNLQKSKHWFQTALNYKNTPPNLAIDIHFYLGEIEKSQNLINWNTHFKNALHLLKKKENKNIMDLYKIASIHQQLNDNQSAVKEFENLLKFYPGDIPDHLAAGIYFHLGEINQTISNYKEALTYFKKCNHLNPQHKKAREGLKNLAILE